MAATKPLDDLKALGAQLAEGKAQLMAQIR